METRATWTDEDLDAMSWDACRIHAVAITDSSAEDFLEDDDLDPTAPSPLSMHLDLDYIVGRVAPSAPGRSFEFWVAPATLTVGSVWAINGDLRAVSLPLETRNLRRAGPAVPRDKAEWHLEGREFDLSFRAWNFTLHLRRPPRRGHRVLRMAERGGISFDMRSFA